MILTWFPLELDSSFVHKFWVNRLVFSVTSWMGVLWPPGGESCETGGELGPESGLLPDDSTETHKIVLRECFGHKVFENIQQPIQTGRCFNWTILLIHNKALV